jgi:predicted metal-dependent hydrolase
MWQKERELTKSEIALIELNPKLQEVLLSIATEVSKAISKHPSWPADIIHRAAIVNEEAGELIQATLEYTYEPGKSTFDDIQKEAVHTGAMAVRFLMAI